MKSLSRVRLLVTPWTAAYQAPPSMGFSRQEYWSGVPLPSPKVCLVKAYVFPVVMYGCESWTVKKADTEKLSNRAQGAGVRIQASYSCLENPMDGGAW